MTHWAFFIAEMSHMYRNLYIIVELKRAGRKMKRSELVDQGTSYVDKLIKILSKQGELSPNIEVVFVLGKPIDEEKNNPQRLKASMESISPGSRITHYDALISGVQNAYSEYLKASKELDAERVPSVRGA